jgi:hypothetical protein
VAEENERDVKSKKERESEIEREKEGVYIRGSGIIWGVCGWWRRWSRFQLFGFVRLRR